jgi:hypothetical protein
LEPKGFHLKLTAILSADVAGYSRLMQDDESATVKTLESYKKIISDLVKQPSWTGFEKEDLMPIRITCQDKWRAMSNKLKK